MITGIMPTTTATTSSGIPHWGWLTATDEGYLDTWSIDTLVAEVDDAAEQAAHSLALGHLRITSDGSYKAGISTAAFCIRDGQRSSLAHGLNLVLGNS